MTAAAKTPPPPKHLSDRAKERWQAVAPFLAPNFDQTMLSLYCQIWIRWQDAEAAIAKSGQLIRNNRGDAVPNPLISVSAKAAAQLRPLERQLGISESTRPAAPSEDDGPPADLLTRRELADRLKCHMQTVTKWEREGMPIALRGRKGKPSKYRELEVRAWLDAREEAAKTDVTVDVARERARKERAQAILAEQTFQIRARKLLPADEVEEVWSAEIAAIRAVILSSYTTHADRVHRASTLDGLRGVELALKEIAYEVLRQLAGDVAAEAS